MAIALLHPGAPRRGARNAIRSVLVVLLLALAGCLDWPGDLLKTDSPLALDSTVDVHPGADLDARDVQPFDLQTSDLGCPSSCTNGCKAGVCQLECVQSPCVCPPGLGCEVDCGQGDCSGSIDCSQATACDIRCDQDNACPGGVVCGSGPCVVECTGKPSCTGGVDCSQSCSCSVEDGPAGKVTCPAFCAGGCAPWDSCDQC